MHQNIGALLRKNRVTASAACIFLNFAYSISNGGPTWVRTRDLPVMSRWLFQLSYGPKDSLS